MSDITAEQQHIDDMNEAIAIFDGWELVKRDGVDCLVKDGYRRYHYELEYNSNWNRLMPVVEKCHRTSYEKQKQFSPNDVHDVNDPTGWRSWSYRFIRLSVNIECVYNEVYQFIQWYNEQNKQQ